MSLINFEEISFQIIAHAGDAKSKAVEACELAKITNIKEANKLLEEAEKSIAIASRAHMDVISAEAAGENMSIPVLFMHAEDQLLTTETMIVMARQFIDLYKILISKNII